MAPRWCIILLFLCSTGLAQAEVSYNKDVLPILAGKCFACHDADEAERKAGLRLDDSKVAYAERNGVRAIVPGKVNESALITRIFASDDEVMPPQSAKNPLTRQEKSTLRQWIEEGAPYEKHWAFTPPSKAPLPKASVWAHNPVDSFIESRLLREGLNPQPSASKGRRLRRASLDLLGLPPSWTGF